MKDDEIFRACDRHRIETVTISKCVADYENMQNWMVELLKLQGRKLQQASGS